MDNRLTKEKIAELATKELQSTISDEDRRLLINWYNDHDDTKLMLAGTSSAEVRRMLDRIVINTLDKVGQRKPQRSHVWLNPFLKIAAVLLICMTLGWVFYLANKVRTQEKMTISVKADAKPGSRIASLLMADGSKIELDSRKNQLIRVDGRNTATNNAGILQYSLRPEKQGTRPDSYNTLNVPKGGEYRLTLSDGTNVHLNAASRLKFPVHFSASERTVELDGEGYFEVKHDSRRPFKVITSGQVVEDLGTAFNIKAYSASPKGIVTTLEHGMIKVSTAADSRIMHPGQQSIVTRSRIVLQTADMKSALAWKNGNMIFNNADLETIMSELARWYDIKYMISENIGNRKFSGGFSRSESLANVLDIFQESGIKFRMVQREGVKTLLIDLK